MSKQARVLYIEDDDVERRSFLRLVRDKGLPWEIKHAETLAAARAALAAARAALAESHFDVIVADNHLPDGESTELLGQAPDTPFVLVTGTPEEQLALRLLERGPDDTLVKDRERRYLEALPSAIEKTLYRKTIEKEHRLMRQLRESEQRLRATFDNVASGIAEVNAEDRLVSVNDRLCQMLGYAREQLLGMSVHELTYPEDRPRTQELSDQLHDGQISMFEHEKRFLKQDGSLLWAHVGGSAVRDGAGQYLYSVGTVVDISARKAAEAALVESEAKYRTLFENMGEEVHFWKLIRDEAGQIKTWRLVDVNPATMKTWGKKLDEIKGKTPDEIFGPGSTDHFMPMVRKISAEGVPYSFETYFPPVSRTFRFILVPLGEYFITTGADITERKRAEEALRQSEAQFRNLAEALPQWVWMTGPDGYHQYFNRRWHDYTGTNFNQTAGAGWSNWLHPDDRQRTLDRWDHSLRTGEPYEIEYRFRASDRTYRWFLGRALPVRDEQGRIIRWFGTCTDIDEQKRAEERLEQRVRQRTAELARALAEAEQGRATLDALLESIPEGIMIADAADHGLVRVSRYAEQMLGADARTLESMTSAEGLKRWESFEPDGVTPVRLESLPLVQAIREGTTVQGRELVLHRGTDGATFSILCSAAPIRDSSGRITGGVAAWRDIAERKRAEEAVRELNETLEHRVAERTEAQRVAKADAERANAAKDHFLAVLSHELRNPLTPVLPALAAMKKLVPQEGAEYLDIARRNVELEAILIDDLLDVTRIARGKVELERKVVDLCTILHHAAEVCKADIEARRLHFGIDIENGPHPVLVDAARLQQVFWNLIKNAVKFTPHGGCVAVRCWREDGQVMTQVIDSGEGIAPEALSRVFNAFEQESHATTRQFGGLGLGLAISKTLVEMHGGTIKAHSEGKGKGATFTVALPMAELRPIEKPAAPTAEAEPPVAARNLRILLVEDHGDTARMMGRLLTVEGHTVQHAGDVATALELAGSGEFDVLVSDLGLPDGSGHDLMRELRARGQRLPGIALSGYGMAADVQKSREAGFMQHLTKPVNVEALLVAVRRVARSPQTPPVG